MVKILTDVRKVGYIYESQSKYELSMNFNYLIKLPKLLAIKDNHSVYQTMTESLANLLGWKSSDDCVGKTDHELPCPASEFALKHIRNDAHTIKQAKPLLTLDMYEYTTSWKLLFTERTPIQLANSPGIITYSADLNDTHIAKCYLSLYCFDRKYFGIKENLSGTYLLNSALINYQLTEKQENILFLLIRGKSIIQIGKILKKSPRTIENHIDALKNKFVCDTKSELIEKAIDLGYLYFLPKNMKHSELENLF